MKDCKFKSLILDVYKEWVKPERTFKKTELGLEVVYNNFWGTIFGGISRDTFDNIRDINGYMEIVNPDMLLLNSRSTKQEIEIYEWNLKDYTIKGDELVLQLKDKVVIFEM